MDYEQKYKESLKAVKELSDSLDESYLTEELEKIFPELKESEDEKIRKRILLSLEKDLMATKNSGCNTKDLEECIAYLEKQGEQKVSIVDFKAEDWYVSKVDGKIHYMKYNPNKGLVWSEEDERMCNASIRACQYMVEHFENSTWDYEDAIDWLKSLKDRVQPQWKPSSEYIAALEYQVNSTYEGSWQYKASKELLEQLKKL